MSKNSNTTNVKYTKYNNTVKMDIHSSQVLPKYLYYVFDYLKIPKNATIVFTDKTVKGGVQHVLDNNQNKF